MNMLGVKDCDEKEGDKGEVCVKDCEEKIVSNKSDEKKSEICKEKKKKVTATVILIHACDHPGCGMKILEIGKMYWHLDGEDFCEDHKPPTAQEVKVHPLAFDYIGGNIIPLKDGKSKVRVSLYHECRKCQKELDSFGTTYWHCDCKEKHGNYCADHLKELFVEKGCNGCCSVGFTFEGIREIWEVQDTNKIQTRRVIDEPFKGK